ncbi:MAG: hypothetical protein CM15mP74_26490 [Halieaceae bacterium]|nr:MAG: hypothetical protein CM15mP74_26490 [Halieaceae bacterium]
MSLTEFDIALPMNDALSLLRVAAGMIALIGVTNVSNKIAVLGPNKI